MRFAVLLCRVFLNLQEFCKQRSFRAMSFQYHVSDRPWQNGFFKIVFSCKRACMGPSLTPGPYYSFSKFCSNDVSFDEIRPFDMLTHKIGSIQCGCLSVQEMFAVASIWSILSEPVWDCDQELQEPFDCPTRMAIYMLGSQLNCLRSKWNERIRARKGKVFVQI